MSDLEAAFWKLVGIGILVAFVLFGSIFAYVVIKEKYFHDPNKPFLKAGAHGPDVEKLQLALQRAGYTLSVDGSFGRTTEVAVRSIQRAAKITVDGMVDDPTWDAINAAESKQETKRESSKTARPQRDTIPDHPDLQMQRLPDASGSCGYPGVFAIKGGCWMRENPAPCDKLQHEYKGQCYAMFASPEFEAKVNAEHHH